MINFRFHLISLIAVFLSLGIGVVMGSTVIDKAIVAGLENRIDTAEKNSIDRKVENERLKNDIKSTDIQDTVLSAHVVKNSLANKTVYIVVAGAVSQDLITETRELLAVSGATLGSEVFLKTDFLNSDKTKISKDLNKVENIAGILNEEKNVVSQTSISLNQLLSLRSSLEPASKTLSSDINNVFTKYNAFTEQEQSSSLDAAMGVSFLVLVNRSELSNDNFIKFVSNFSSKSTSTIGLVGSDTDQPFRSKSISLLTNSADQLCIVDNVESPSGRATLMLAHAGTISGLKNIYGISSKAKAPAPELSGS
ncbi:MAG: copper transporter [Acidimicrobiia bacterium]